MVDRESRIVVAGAGAVGCFVGGLLAAAGRDVALLGRARIGAEIGAHGVHLSDIDGAAWTVAPEYGEDPAVMSGADLVLVCVKSGATAEMAALVAAHAPDGAVVISLQNGVRNAGVLRDALPGRDVRAGMVGFNVVHRGAGRFHRATSGEIVVGAGPGGWAALLSVPGLVVEERADVEAVQWGKLLLNLTNAVNALSGMPLREMFLRPAWRRVMAAQLAEALSVLKAAGIEARVPLKAPGWTIPHVLRLPTWAFSRVAAPMLKVDGAARTSMVADLEAGRRTEIDVLQGEVLALAEGQGKRLPVMERITAEVRRAEQEGLREVSAQALLTGGRPHV